MTRKKKNVVKKIVDNTNYYYILKVEARQNNKLYTFYKIGESDNVNRPKSLCDTYTKTVKGLTSLATQLCFETLPCDNSNRLNDKTIHRNINNKIMTKVDRNLIAGIFRETDGYNEFFELKDTTVDPVNYIKDLVAQLGKDSSNFTVSLQDKPMKLTYKPAQNHMVTGNMIEIIRKVGNIDLSRDVDKNNLIVGQYEPEWVATHAVNNDTTIWHDAKDQCHIYNYSRINEHINYISSAQEVLDMNKKFDHVITNYPYGAIGTNIMKTITNKVDFDNCVNVFPLSNYDVETARHIDWSSVVVCPPHSFGDADILTHVVRYNKQANPVILTETDVIAASFTVDKPMIKFMQANAKTRHYAFDNISVWNKDCVIRKTFVYHGFITNSQHTAGMPKLDSYCISNEYNFNNKAFINKDEAKKAGFTGYLGSGTFRAIRFDTVVERENFINFCKTNYNFINRMIADQFIAYRNQAVCWPKVDWKRNDWTVEKILKEFNYTDDEVKEVIDTTNDRNWLINDDASIERLFGEWLNEIK